MKSLFQKLKSIALIRHVTILTAPNLVEMLAKTIVIAVVIAHVSKEDFGYISIAMLFFSYSGYLQLGTSNALMLRLPDLNIHGKHELIVEYLYTSVKFVLSNIILISILLFITLYGIGYNVKLLAALAAYVISSALYQIYIHYLMAYRYTYNLKPAAIARLVLSGTRLLAQTACVILWGFKGFLAAEALLYIFPIIILRACWHLPEKKTFNISLLKELLKVGLPLVVISVIGILVLTLDRWFAAYVSGEEGIAIYSTIAYIGSVLLIIPNQVLSLFSQYSREVLAKGYTKQKLINNYLSLIILFITSWGCIGLAIEWGGYYLFTNVTTKYSDAAALLPYIVILTLLRICVNNLSNYFIICDKQKIPFYSNIIALISLCLGNIIGIYLTNETLSMVITITLVASFTQLLFYLYNLRDIVKSSKQLYILLLIIGFYSSLTFIAHTFLIEKSLSISHILTVIFCGFTGSLITLYIMKGKRLKDLIDIAKRDYAC